jgi:hypothetical protein
MDGFVAAVLVVATALAAGIPDVPAGHFHQSTPRRRSSCPAPRAEPRTAPASILSVARLTLARCVQQDLDAGRWRDAEARLVAARQAGAQLGDTDRRAWQSLVVRLDATRMVDTGRWAALAASVVPQEEALPWAGPLVRGVAAARASWAQQDATLQARARRELDRLADLARQAGPLSEEERARLVVQGTMAGAQYERDEMQLLLDAAHDLELRLLAGDELRVPVVLAWEVEADLLRMTDRYAAASERYRDLLVEWPRRVQGRIGLADAYRRLGYAREADETLAQARALWAGADPEALALINATVPAPAAASSAPRPIGNR